jgi:transcriptional regulator with XRE-family HTH domain
MQETNNVNNGDRNMNGRIKKVRNHLKMTQKEFGDILGIGRDAISNIELNRAEIKEPIIKLICKEFSINEAWLRTGVGDMFYYDDREDELAVWAGNLIRESGMEDNFMKQFVHMLSKLNTDDWKVLEKMARILSEEKK